MYFPAVCHRDVLPGNVASFKLHAPFDRYAQHNITFSYNTAYTSLTYYRWTFPKAVLRKRLCSLMQYWLWNGFISPYSVAKCRIKNYVKKIICILTNITTGNRGRGERRKACDAQLLCIRPSFYLLLCLCLSSTSDVEFWSTNFEIEPLCAQC